MNQSSYESEIRDHYANVHLDETLVEHILDAGQFAASARRWKQIAITASLALAAMIVLAVSLFLSGPPDNQPLAKFEKPSELHDEPELDPVEVDVKTTADTKAVEPNQEMVVAPEQYRLVAFRSHSNACPHCRATGIVYHELEKALDETPLEFMEFDLSNDESRERTDQTIEELELTSLVAGRSETAFIALTDLNGKPLQEFKPSMGSKKIVEQVRKLIKH